MLYCKDCKYCQLNQKFVVPETKGIFGWFKKLKAYIGFRRDQEIMLATSTPLCLHPEVYKEDLNNTILVFGTSAVPAKIHCSIAREESSNRFHCCGKEGKYFEAK